MPKVVHFEVMADNPESILSFYSDVFGWKSNKWDGPMDYWLIDTGEGPGIGGGIARKQEGGPGVINTIDVDSVDSYTEKVQSSGGKVAMPKMAVPGVGWMAYCTDPEGNLFGIMEEDSSAA